MSVRWRQNGLGWAALGFLVLHVILTAPSFGNMISPVLGEPNLSYSAKMARNWGYEYFDTIEFVAKNTPENSTVLFGPGWYGTPERSMLYPRRLFFGGHTVLQLHPEIQYIVIKDNYPDFQVDGERLMLNEKSGLVKIRR